MTTGIWRPRFTEREYWTLTALPSTKKTSWRERLFTLNVSNVEVAYHYHSPANGEDLGGAFYVSTGELGKRAAARIRKRFAIDLSQAVHSYLSADETGIDCPALSDFPGGHWRP